MELDAEDSSSAAAATGRPSILADPLRRGDGVALDALGYLDDELDEEPGMREVVDQLILEEMRRMSGIGAYAAELPTRSAPPLLTSCLEDALSAVADGRRLSASVTAPDFSALAAPASDSAADWSAAVSRAQVAVEAQSLRAINVELLSKYGVEAWQQHVAGLNRLEASSRARVTRIQGELDGVNAARRAAQERARGKLGAAAKRTHAAIDTITQVYGAVADASVEVRRLKRRALEAGLIEDADSGGGIGGGAS